MTTVQGKAHVLDDEESYSVYEKDLGVKVCPPKGESFEHSIISRSK